MTSSASRWQIFCASNSFPKFLSPPPYPWKSRLFSPTQLLSSQLSTKPIRINQAGEEGQKHAVYKMNSPTANCLSDIQMVPIGVMIFKLYCIANAHLCYYLEFAFHIIRVHYIIWYAQNFIVQWIFCIMVLSNCRLR